MVENAIIVIISILSLSLLLTQINSIELPIIFALKAKNTLAAGPPPQFGTSPELSASQMSTSTNKGCTLLPSTVKLVGTPQQTEGPYFVDGMPERSDIRSDPSDGSMQEGHYTL